MFFKKIVRKLLNYLGFDMIRIKKPLSISHVVPKNTLPEFGNWLRFANAGMLSDGNIDSFEYAIKNLPSESPLIEIGSFCGLSTNIINFYLREPLKTITN